MKKILVPIDFSDESVNAFVFALDIATTSRDKGVAAANDVSVSLLHVLALPVLHESPVMSVEGLKRPLIDELTQVANERFAKIIAKFNTRNIKVTSEVVVSNRIHDMILESIKKHKPDLVAMGTKGVSGFRELLFGSNTERIVRTSPVPVLAVKEHVAGNAIRNIVFPNTLELEDQEELISKVKALQAFFDAHLHILWINTPALHRPEPQVREDLEEFASRYMFRNYTINIFSYTDEESGIVEFTKQMKGDLIAMGTHGLRGISHLIAGSIAEDVVNHVKTPVWTYCTNSALSVLRQN